MKTKLTPQDWGMLIGQKVEYHACNLEQISTLVAVKESTDGDSILTMYNGDFFIVGDHFCKPILRTIDQMTVEDAEEIVEKFDLPKSINDDACQYNKEYVLSLIEDEFTNEDLPNLYDHLTQKGLDLRGWIELGLAIKQEDK